MKGRSSRFIPKKFIPTFGRIKVENARRVPKRKIAISESIIFLYKWARQDSNLRPTDYESVALTNWATGPKVKKE